MPQGYEGEWAYAYALPSGCLRPLAVYIQGITDLGKTEPFTIEAADAAGTQVVLTDAPGAYLKYTAMVEDTSRYPPSVVLALSYLLATRLASPITRSGDIIGAMDKMYRLTLESAKTLDASAHDTTEWHDETSPFWLTAR